MATSRIGGGVGVDTRDLKAFIGALRKASPTAAVGMRESLRAGGEIVAREARTLAGEHSDRIPATIKTRVRGATVSVVAGGANAPVAAPWEMGNKGSRSDSTTFRHRVFGQDVWVEQARYPFLRPAAKQKAPELEAEVLKVADEIARILTDRIGL